MFMSRLLTPLIKVIFYTFLFLLVNNVYYFENQLKSTTKKKIHASPGHDE